MASRFWTKLWAGRAGDPAGAAADAGDPASAPAALARLELRGIAVSPVRYLRSRLRERR